MPSPLKRRRKRRRTKLSPPRYTSCSSGSDSGDDGGQSESSRGPFLWRYQPSLLDERLGRLDLPPSADGVEPDSSVDLPDPPYGEILQALTRPCFLDDDQTMRDAVAEYQVHEYLSTPRDPISDENLDVYSVDDDIPHEEFVDDVKRLMPRTPVDTYNKLDDPEVVEEHELKRALYRVKALLLLKGKAIGKLDDAALEIKYPRKLIVENEYFLDYENHAVFSWYFDPDLCELAALTDYQRLVIVNAVEDQYQDWSRYRSHYNTPETDREYLLYWEAITQKMKWIEDCMHIETSSLEWMNIWTKACSQATRIATGFKNIHKDLALLGIEEFIWRTRLYGYYLKGLDGVFYEIWKRVILEENAKDYFTKALKEVYDLKMFPSCERFMKHEKTLAEQFHMCTAGITKEVPDSIARGLIAQQVRRKLANVRGYEHYARKKLKVAEFIGLIGRTLRIYLHLQ